MDERPTTTYYHRSVPIQDVALKTYRERWTIETDGERGSGRSVQAARHDDNDDDKLLQIEPSLQEWRPVFRKSWLEQVIISRLHIGHTRLTQSFMVKKVFECQIPCIVKSVLMKCRTFTLVRMRFFKGNSLSDLLENIKMEDVLSFLRETGLYQKIWWTEII